MPTSDMYRRFATAEAHGESPCYEQWSLGIAADDQLLALIDELPPAKRQPNLLFGAARYLGIPAGPFTQFRELLHSSWPQVRDVMAHRATQTNEPGRCALLLPLLASIPGPLALLEVGASAGLCLYPDRLSYQYDERPQLDPIAGPGPTVLACATTGPVPFPTSLPEVVWRAGLDLNPLDVADDDDMRWLEALIWPEHEHRRQRLDAVIAVARADTPRLVTGDLTTDLRELAAQAPTDATLVIFHSAVLSYVDPAGRADFIETARDLPGHWIANEGHGVVLTEHPAPRPHDGTRELFLMTMDGEPMAYTAPHGQSLSWLVA
jgi:hypothetical protein